MNSKNKVIIFLCGFFVTTQSEAALACGGEKCCFLEKDPYQTCPAPYASAVYTRMSAGLSVLPKLTMGYENGTQVLQSETVFDNGYDADIGVGYRFMSNFRAELAAGHIYNLVSRNSSNSIENTIYGGHVSVYTAFFNLYYDFNFHSKFTPYLGGGVGYLNRSYQWQLNNGSPENDYTTSYASPAAQAIAGVAYAVTKKFSVTLDYRYMGTPTDGMTISNQAGGTAAAAGRYQLNYLSNLVNLGVSYQF